MKTSSRAVIFDQPQAYDAMVALQERLLAARIEDKIPDTVLFLEHQPVVTLGRRGRDNFLRASPAKLRELGIDFAHASRGGDVTFHGPGQIVVYPIIKLGDREADAHGYLGNLEEVAIRTAADFGVKAWRREGLNGAWTASGKIAAIGFRLKRWVTSHGMSFNVSVDLGGFETIVPCGLVGEPVASLSTILGKHCPSLAEVRTRLMNNFETIMDRRLEIEEGTNLRVMPTLLVSLQH